MSNSNRSLGDLDKHAFKEDEDNKGVVYRRVCDEAGNALLQQIADSLANGGGGPGGTTGVTCQRHVVNLVANNDIIIPHTFNNEVCDFKAFDSLGNEIEIGFKYNANTLELKACASVDVENVLIIVEGEST